MPCVQAERKQQIIPTYIPKPAHELPMFFENKPYQGASGRIYPIAYSDGITDEKTDVAYDVITLQNEYIMTQVAPELGGKILRGYDKVGEHDFIYYNEVVKPALVGIAGPWISGGIEFNWPQHHRPTTFMPLEAVVEEDPNGGKTVWVGEIEPLNHLKGMVGISVDPHRSYIRAKIRVYNRTAQAQPFMWWANLAVPVNDDYRTVFPPDCEWVNDHDRRAVLSWPVAKGVYKTARPYDFGDGVDLSHYSAVKVPSSYLISQGQSDMDFIAGYDEGIGKGIATVADHHIAPGKKMWHWGIGDFGDMWCGNLTDRNGPYIELMTGVYTDNQPDFTWIAPYETREFEQYWYPIRDIGQIKNASIDAAVNLEQRGKELFFGFHVTGVFNGARVRVTENETEIFSQTLDMSPDKTYIKTIPYEPKDFYAVRVSLLDCNGRELVAYSPYRRGQKQPIEPRMPVKRPKEYKTVEELYINGLHLEQYKQHNYRPEDYYLEGLKRDPGDIRCNTSMGRLALKNGQFKECVEYCDKAIARLTSRNQHPVDTEALYLKGMALRYLGREREACDVLNRAAWNYSHRSAALYQLACIHCKNGEYAAALEKLEEVLCLNRRSTKAYNLRTAIFRKLERPEAQLYAEAGVRDDRLDLLAILEASHYTTDPAQVDPFVHKAENLLDAARDYMEAGLLEDAVYVLSFADQKHPLVNYYLAYLTGNHTYLQKAEALPNGYCFPNSLEDIAVLQYAIDSKEPSSNACYYLGCLYYDRFRYEDAAQCFHSCVNQRPDHGKAWRNLSLYYFDKAGKPSEALDAMERALRYRPDDPRLLLEYQQLLKNTNTPIAQRLEVYDRYPELLRERDDCYLDKLTLLSQQGKYTEAIQMAAVKRFHIYEGGEGKLTKQHAWMHVLYGNVLAQRGALAEAEQTYLNGINMPKSYGEAKTFFNQEAHIYYFLAKLYERTGRTEQARQAYHKAAEYKAAVSEISLFRALALRELGDHQTEQAVLQEMLEKAEQQIRDCDLRSYYGVGSPSPMPFEQDIVRQNLLQGYCLKAFALYGIGQAETAMEFIQKAETIDPNDYCAFIYRQIVT